MENKNIKDLWRSSQLFLTDKLEYPPIILKSDDSILATLGNFSATIGKAKSRKTFSVTALTAAALSNQMIIGYYASLPANKRKILYFDTEQSHFHCYKALKNIVDLSGNNLDIHPQNLDFFCLRKHDPLTRCEIIEEGIKNTPEVGLIICDGIRDLVFDINSPSESTAIISKLMKWTEMYNVHIHVVLHVNKTDDNARGHLGTEILNKAETVLQVYKDPKQPEISIVKPISIKDKEFEPFAFKITQDGVPEVADEYMIENGISKNFDYYEVSADFHKKALTQTFENNTQLSYGELIENLISSYKELGYTFGINKAKSLKVFCENKNMILKKGKNYSFNPSFYY